MCYSVAGVAYYSVVEAILHLLFGSVSSYFAGKAHEHTCRKQERCLHSHWQQRLWRDWDCRARPFDCHAHRRRCLQLLQPGRDVDQRRAGPPERVLLCGISASISSVVTCKDFNLRLAKLCVHQGPPYARGQNNPWTANHVPAAPLSPWDWISMSVPSSDLAHGLLPETKSF